MSPSLLCRFTEHAGGRYEVCAQLGAGDMGNAYLSEGSGLRRMIAAMIAARPHSHRTR